MSNSPSPSEAQYVNDVRHHLGYFTPNPHMLIGNADSGHHVMFGEIPELGEVAIKPFTQVDKALNERRALDKVRGMPNLEALEPLVVAEGALASYLVTRYRDDLDHLGMVDWAATITKRRTLRDVIEPTLGDAAAAAALWHSKGIAHGDLQVKNLSHTPQGTPVMVDAERTAFHVQPEHHTLATNRDIQKLGRSALDRGLLADRSASYRAGFLSQHLLEPYLEAVAVAGKKFSQPDEERQRVITDYWVSAIMPDGAKRRHARKLPTIRHMKSRKMRRAATLA